MYDFTTEERAYIDKLLEESDKWQEKSGEPPMLFEKFVENFLNNCENEIKYLDITVKEKKYMEKQLIKERNNLEKYKKRHHKLENKEIIKKENAYEI